MQKFIFINLMSFVFKGCLDKICGNRHFTEYFLTVVYNPHSGGSCKIMNFECLFCKNVKFNSP